jgi:hypothetical protein
VNSHGDSAFKGIIACFVMGGYLALRGFHQMKRQRLVEDMPTSKNRSAPQGLVELQGYAWPVEKTVRCTKLNDCASYSILLQEYRRNGRKNSYWVTVFEAKVAADFLLLDPTGAIYVNTESAEKEVRIRETNWEGLSTELQQQLLNTTLVGANAAGFPPTPGILGSLFGGRFRIVEYFVTLGSPVLALGEFKTYSAKPFKITPSTGLSKFFEKVKSDPNLKIGTSTKYFDLDKNGKVEPDEVRRGMHYLARSLMNTTAPETDAPDIPYYGTISNSENHPLYVADAHRNMVAQDNPWSGLLTFLGGVALIVAGIYMLIFEIKRR